MAGQVDHGEEQVAYFLRPFRIGRGGGDFRQFLLDLCDHAVRIGPVEPRARRALLQLLGAKQRGQGHGHARQRAGIRLLFRAFGCLDRLPLRMPVFAPGAFTKDMRMAADHLSRNAVDHVLKREMSGLFGHATVKGHLKQQIAQFVAQRFHVAPLDRVHDLIGFLDRVGRDRREILRDVPRTSGVRIAQPRHYGDERHDVGGARSCHPGFRSERREIMPPE